MTLIMLKKILLESTNNTFLQFIRYTFVGGFAFVVDFILLYVLTEYMHIYYLLSATISFTVGLIVNYLFSKIWIFQTERKIQLIEFLVFSFIGVIGLGFNNLFLWLFTEYCAIHYLLAKIFTTIIVYIWNFFARKYILFNK